MWGGHTGVGERWGWGGGTREEEGVRGAGGHGDKGWDTLGDGDTCWDVGTQGMLG